MKKAATPKAKAVSAESPKKAASSRARATKPAKALTPVIPVAEMRESSAKRQVARAKKTTPKATTTRKPSSRTRAETIPTPEPMVSVRASRTMDSVPAVERSSTRPALRSSRPRRVHPDVLSERTRRAEPMILAETFMAESVITDTAPRKKNGMAVTVGLLSIAMMGIAGAFAFGPSHAEEITPTPTPVVASAPAAATGVTPTDPAKPGDYTIIGKINTINTDGTLSLTTLSPTGSATNSKDYTIRLDGRTSYFHQIPSTEEKGIVSYSVVRGQESELKAGDFVSLTTDDDTVKDAALLAATVNYSEVSPFDDGDTAASSAQ